MDVLILHYHLNPGGVTRIIESQVKGINLNDANLPVRILCGHTSGEVEIENAEIIHDNLLNYTDDTVADTKILLKQFADITALVQSYVGSNTIIHTHNLNLGKNPVLTASLYNLASRGLPVINHCHDFPEDRPDNMILLERVLPVLTSHTVKDILYPAFRNYHYVVLNSCDYKRLIETQVPDDRIHLLPNPVQGTGVPLPNKEKIREKVCSQLNLRPSSILCTYPVRAIERKNIGEFILMAVLFGDVAEFVITLSPLNPVEIPMYEQWKEFCARNKIRIRFEAGNAVDFKDLLAASDFCITTSVREGFGMVYLEPWLAGTPVIGRGLPCVIDDLQKEGIRFPRLYEKFEVESGNRKSDFKDLCRNEKEIVIESALKNSLKQQELMSMNVFLKDWLKLIPSEIIVNNQKIIRQKFSPGKYGQQLLGIYKEISQ